MCDTDHNEPVSSPQFSRRHAIGMGAAAAAAATVVPGLTGRQAAYAAAEVSPDNYEAPTGLALDSNAKDTALGVIDRTADAITGLNDTIWEYAEPSLAEWNSALAEADFLRRAGFRIQWAVGGLPSTFVATFSNGTGSPVIGFSGEYDALPGVSQKKGSTEHDPLVYHDDPYSPNYGYGHGCGHSALGAAAAGAAVAVANALRRHRLDGTVKFFGSTAEEQLVGKSYDVMKGVYDGCDVFVDWHPGRNTSTGFGSNNALKAIAFNFSGTHGHGGSPLGNKNAQNAVRALTMLTDMIREHHVAPSGRIHHAIRHSAEAPNVHAALAGAWYFVREATPERVAILAQKVSDCAQAAGLAMQMDVHERVVANIWNKLPNKRGAELVHDNMVQIGAPEFTDEDQAYGKGLQAAAGIAQNGYSTGVADLRPPESTFLGGGSTDVSDISWIIPTLSLGTPVSPSGTANHSWLTTGSTVSHAGHTALIAAARYLAAIAVDLFTQPALVAEIKAEHAARTANVEWASLLPADFQPPAIAPPDWFLKRTGQKWPNGQVAWPPERIVGHTKWDSLGPPVPPGNVQPYE